MAYFLLWYLCIAMFMQLLLMDIIYCIVALWCPCITVFQALWCALLNTFVAILSLRMHHLLHVLIMTYLVAHVMLHGKLGSTTI